MKRRKGGNGETRVRTTVIYSREVRIVNRGTRGEGWEDRRKQGPTEIDRRHVDKLKSKSRMTLTSNRRGVGWIRLRVRIDNGRKIDRSIMG